MIAGCAVGPNYKRPVVDSPSAFRDDNSPTNISFADLDWWQVYRDGTLQALIREAFTNNYDLRIAVTRVEQARAVAMQARSQFVPNVEYNGAVSRGRNDLFGSAFPNNAADRQFRDSHTQRLLGSGPLGPRPPAQRVRPRPISGLGGSAARRPAEPVERRWPRITSALLELDQELEIVQRTTNSFGESLKIFTRRLEGGTATDLEASRAEAALADAASATPSVLERDFPDGK